MIFLFENDCWIEFCEILMMSMVMVNFFVVVGCFGWGLFSGYGYGYVGR